MQRHGQPPVGHGPARRQVAQRGVDHLVLQAARQHALARGLGGGGRAVGPAALGRLRDGDEQRRFGGAEVLGLLAEIGERGGAHALEVAAHRRQGQVDRQHLALGVAPFELQGARRLEDLRPQGAARSDAEEIGLQQPGGLHGERRGARHDAAAVDPLLGRAHRGQRIDAPVVVEAAILVGLEQGEIDRIDVVDGGPEPPLAVRRGEGAQQAAVGVDDLGRPVVVARQVGREDPVERQRPRRQRRGGERESGEETAQSHLNAARSRRGPWRCGHGCAGRTCRRRSRPAGRSCPASRRARCRRHGRS